MLWYNSKNEGILTADQPPTPTILSVLHAPPTPRAPDTPSSPQTPINWWQKLSPEKRKALGLEMNAARREMYRKRKEAGQCVICGKWVPRPGKATCTICAIWKSKYRQKTQSHRRRPTEERWKRRVREKVLMELGGRCSFCGDDDVNRLVLQNIGKPNKFIGGLLSFIRFRRNNHLPPHQVVCGNCRVLWDAELLEMETRI